MRLGVKAAPRDLDAMLALEHVSFVETVLWGGDLEGARLDEVADVFSVAPEVVVHAPFTVPGGPEVDVAATDPALRRASVATWQRTVELADRLDATWVVLHPGGILPTPATPDDGPLRADALERIEAALQELVAAHGRDRLLMENMPSHYHRSDGTTDRCIAGVGVLDLLAWRDLLDGFCLDVSHAFLTPGAGRTLDSFVGRAGAHLRHLHVADAAPPDHEGLPIGAGDVDWARLRDAVRGLDAGRALTAVPEVKDGHRDGGAGFRLALDFLATHFL